jgi:hypothetical protein
MNIDYLDVKKLATGYLRAVEAKLSGVSYVLMEVFAKEDVDGWYFPYQSKSFIEGEDFNQSLVGNWPIFVDRSGQYVGPRCRGIPISK